MPTANGAYVILKRRPTFLVVADYLVCEGAAGAAGAGAVLV
jgi:hypothetical protein